jgi:RNA 3'-terminal phosphate cyclase
MFLLILHRTNHPVEFVPLIRFGALISAAKESQNVKLMLERVLQTILLLCLKALVGIRLFFSGDTRVDHCVPMTLFRIVACFTLGK